MGMKSVNMHQCPYDKDATCVDALNAPEDCWEDRGKRNIRCETYTIYQQRERIRTLENELTRTRAALEGLRTEVQDIADCIEEGFSGVEIESEVDALREALDRAERVERGE